MIKKVKKREQRIIEEIIVDAYDAEEQAMGWYYYLEDKLEFPFAATCTKKRAISPLHIDDEIDVIDIAPVEECGHEMFVMIRWEKDVLAVPLMQLKVTHGEGLTQEAAEDWSYWVDRGYELG